MTQDLYTMKRSLELEWQQEHLKQGRYSINMAAIDKKIQEVVKRIVTEEFEEDMRLTQAQKAKPQVSIAT